MPRRETPLESGDTALLRFAGDLRRLRDGAGRPTYRELARRAHYSAAALSEATNGRKLPSLAVTLAFVRACGGDVEEWGTRWREVATYDEPKPLTGDVPYVGLAAFQTGDAHRFFGREELTASIVGMVRERRFTGVFGASGSGKSSVLRAGLAAEADGPVLILTPGADPVQECAVGLAELTGESVVTLRTGLAADPGHLHLWIRRSMARKDLLLVVDQFEEVFTLCEARQRNWLVTALTTAANTDTSRARIVIGVRADFYGHCGRHPELVAALHRAQILVGPMTPDELRRAITEPAARAGATVETALVARLVADVAGQAAALPLVSHALVETWRRRRGMTMSLAGYEEAGGVEHALARTAEDVFGALSEDQRQSARRILLRLIALGEGTEDTRRRVQRQELEADPAVLDRLATARLIVLDRDTVELTHEALIRSWPRLRDWIAEDREALRVHRKLVDATDTWEDHDHDTDTLYRGVRLEQARELPDLTARERAFLDASTTADDQRRATARRRTRRLRQYVAVLAVLVLVLGGTAAYAVVSQRTATEERNNALSLRAADAALAMARARPDEAVRLALAAYRVSPTVEAVNALRAVLGMAGGGDFKDPLKPGERFAAVAPQGRVGFSMTYDDPTNSERPTSFALWAISRTSFVRVAERRVPGSGILPVFSMDGRFVVVQEIDRSMAHLWDVTDPRRPREVTAFDLPVRRPSGTDDAFLMAVSGVSDSGKALTGYGRFQHADEPREMAMVMRVDDGGGITAFELPGQGVQRIALRPDGRVAAVVRSSATSAQVDVEIWELGDAEATRRGSVAVDVESAFRLRFGPDGRFLALTDYRRGSLFVVDTADPHSPGLWAGLSRMAPQSPNAEFEFAPDGRTLVLIRPGGVDLWDIGDQGEPRRVAYVDGLGDNVTGLTLRPETRDLLAVTDRSELLRFDFDDEQLVRDACTRPAGPGFDWNRHFPGVAAVPLCPG